jgi:quercetin dioxygenase-like cupin family protein
MAIKRGFFLAFVALALTVGTAFASHTAIGLTSTLLGRGTMDRADLSGLVRELGAMRKMARSDVAVVRASIAPGGTTDWHGHPGPSIVVVTVGTVRLLEPTANGDCQVEDYVAGEAFFHQEGAHNFVNPSGTVTAEFLVTYFAPAGPLLIHATDPGTC